MYEAEQGTVTTALQGSSTSVFSDDTIAKILALTTSDNATVRFDTVGPDANGNVTVAAGSEVVLVTSSDTSQSTLTVPSNAPVVIFQGRGGVAVDFGGNATVPASGNGIVDRVVVGSAGSDNIVLDGRNTHITLGQGDTVVSGGGNDTIVAGMGNSTVVGGSGFEVVKLGGSASDYTVTVNNGHAVVTNSGSSHATDISKIQYVQLDNGSALVFAKNSAEAAVSTLYHVMFGRDADVGGLDYWFDVARAGATLKQIASGFTNSAEFAPIGALSDTQYVQALYLNTFNRAGEDAGVAYWIDALAHGSTRADLATSFAQIGANNIAGEISTEAQIVGSVTIIDGII